MIGKAATAGKGGV